MPGTEELLTAAERVIRAAERDLGNGLYESACMSAQRGSVLATEAMLRRRGHVHVSDRVTDNISFCAEAGADLRESAELLDRFRGEEGSAHRSGREVSNAPEEAPRVLAASKQILAFARAQLGLE